MKKVNVEFLGNIDYKEAWDYQEKIFDGILQEKSANRKREENEKVICDNYLLFCEHPHVYTLGKSGKFEHLLINNKQLEEKGAKYYKINRGGDITYHGPGQIVVYPIFDLEQYFTDIHKYLRFLEEAVILTLKEYGIHSERSEGETGVWLDVGTMNARKICAMGVRASRWVTMHGLAFNINTDLDYFTNIIPCGITDKSVTSLNIELRRHVDQKEVEQKLLKHIQEQFEFTIL
ncbi:MAG: lipoyl(octanoyl) transferase LipB [Flavobacteriales bacterium]